MFRSRCSIVVAFGLLFGCLLQSCGGQSTGPTQHPNAPVVCPEGIGFCGVFVQNDCAQSPCAHRPLAGLDRVELVRLVNGGLPDADGAVVVEPNDDGVFFAALAPGSYHVRPLGDRFSGFIVSVGDAPVIVDCRSPRVGSRLIGRIQIAVGGGADGNTTVSSGGPGKFLVASIQRFLDKQRFDPAASYFAIGDKDGRFEITLPPGRYYISDITQATGPGDRTFASSITPISGQTVEIVEGETKSIELTAHEMAP